MNSASAASAAGASCSQVITCFASLIFASRGLLAMSGLNSLSGRSVSNV